MGIRWIGCADSQETRWYKRQRMSLLEHLHGPWRPWEWLREGGSPLVSSGTLLLALPLNVYMKSGQSPPVSGLFLRLQNEMNVWVSCSNGCSEKQMGLGKNSLATARRNTHRLAVDFLLLRWLVDSDSWAVSIGTKWVVRRHAKSKASTRIDKLKLSFFYLG